MSLAVLDILRGLQSVVLILGLIVVYYASKGYRKTKSKSLLFLALGFVFVAVGAALAGLFFEFLNYDLTSVAAIEAGAEVVGFSLIVYSIVGSRD
ncbi:MAG: hypothetical protein PXY39_00290 [archaeon]|nr:hypothetical protein [archaeon]